MRFGRISRLVNSWKCWEGETFVPLLPCTLSICLFHLAVPELYFNNKLVRICLPMQDMWIQSLGWEDPLEKEWQLTPVFLPGKSHGQRNLEDYSSWGCKRVGYDLASKEQQQQMEAK